MDHSLFHSKRKLNSNCIGRKLTLVPGCRLMLEKGLICSGCKLMCHKKCYSQIVVSCKNMIYPQRHHFGVPLDILVKDSEGPVSVTLCPLFLDGGAGNFDAAIHRPFGALSQILTSLNLGSGASCGWYAHQPDWAAWSVLWRAISERREKSRDWSIAVDHGRRSLQVNIHSYF